MRQSRKLAEPGLHELSVVSIKELSCKGYQLILQSISEPHSKPITLKLPFGHYRTLEFTSKVFGEFKDTLSARDRLSLLKSVIKARVVPSNKTQYMNVDVSSELILMCISQSDGALDVG